ncbi:FAD-dependent oxidoreductase [Vibrio sp. 10N.286.49.C2]|uniref:FAD-dependent oxidoreductase n=1 Tax=unclassified Vibrio TaxID=2614977 RepID=UPI000C845EAA|nr:MULTISPECIES: FAD-dependent oxidoreductase [unclassified Vibrio]PMH43365.1 FAD-dependent oxidoreductase [Vibrio sp. 10N.286.49.C2]PMH57017.1 FAD-dependent oxidoreductase [Vibrio sp. 10N.286.49.B1]PMH82999.1 FAD-dependent oxidoreductase [Vibrio sp. 10N.286.48.B7]
MSKEYSYWLHDALGSDQQPVETLDGDISVDVAIVGGGFTGLWSAILLKQKQPDLTVAVLEKGRCGSGASGYNGGCLLTWATKYPTLKKLFGQTEAQWLVKESEDVISEIRKFCEEYKVDAELFTNGTYYTATNQAQSGTMDPVVAALEAENVNSWANVAPESLPSKTGSKVHKEAFYSPAAGSVQPAKLARGLMRVAKELGVQVYENTPMLSLDESQPAVVTTETGRVKAKNVIFATNAWLIEQFPEFKRSIVVVSSDMVLTKPVEGKLAEFGPEKGVTVVDSRIFVHYYRDTKDGRLMLGKGGNRFSFGNKVDGMFHSTSRYLTQLESSFSWLFPYLNKSDIAHSWTGGSDRSVTGLPFFDRLRGHPHIFYGLGYSGNGVAQTRIGAKILSSMVLKEDNAYTQCGLAKGPRGYFPPEPFRWCGAMMVRNAVRRKEAAEQQETTPLLIDRWLSKLAGAAGKADKL